MIELTDNDGTTMYVHGQYIIAIRTIEVDKHPTIKSMIYMGNGQIFYVQEEAHHINAAIRGY